MKHIDKTVISKLPPRSKEVMWLDASEENSDAQLKAFINGKWQPVVGSGESGSTESMIEITYSELKNLRDDSNLSPGYYYRITDYQCTTTQEGTQSAGHQFDIIVRADDVNILNENAFAIEHEDDTYFSNANLGAWELKYCLDNDTNRFAWADPTNGKGVIYYMKDEWDNECPYDFKNIMFLRGQDWRDEHQDISQVIFGDCEEEYFYTFSCYETDDLQLNDASLKNCDDIIHDAEECSCFGNIIKAKRGQSRAGSDSGHLPMYLNNIVFFNTYNVDSYFYCNSNLFEVDCYENTFGDCCHKNTFGCDCNSNMFGDNCYYNTFGDDCYENTFGSGCNHNMFGDNCYNNTFGLNCSCNTFGNECYYNKFGNVCSYNTFGNDCVSNKFGSSNAPQSYFQNIIFESGNKNINLVCSQTASGSNPCRNILVSLGVNISNTDKTITITEVNQTHKTIVKTANDVEITV